MKPSFSTRFINIALNFVLVGLCLFDLTLRAQTVVLTQQITIKPIFIQNGSGGAIAVLDNPLFKAQFDVEVSAQGATQMIFAQAGLKVVWDYNPSSPTIYTSSANFVIDNSTEMQNLARTVGHGQSASATTINLWFWGGSGGSVYGISEQSVISNVTNTLRNGVTISEAAFANNIVHVIAHEIGHNLALNHNLLPPNQAQPQPVNNLMYSANPGLYTTSNIYPFGLQYAFIDPDQRTRIASEILGTFGTGLSFVQPLAVSEQYTYAAVPETAYYSLAGGVVVGIYVLRRCRRSRAYPFCVDPVTKDLRDGAPVVGTKDSSFSNQ